VPALGQKLTVGAEQRLSAPDLKCRPALQLPGHHPLRCRDNERCSLSFCDQEATVPRADYPCVDKSASPWYAEASECQRIQASPGDPLRDKSSILSSCDATVSALPTAEHELTGLFTAGPQVFIDSLARLLSQFEPDRLSCLLLADRGTISSITVGRNVLDFLRHHRPGACYRWRG
jgi:hypothetical protein